MPPFIVIINPPEDAKDPFHQVQEEIDRSQWQGRGPNYILEGGGNHPSTGVKPESEKDRYDE